MNKWAILLTVTLFLSWQAKANVIEKIGSAISLAGDVGVASYRNNFRSAFTSTEDYFRIFDFETDTSTLPTSLLDDSLLNGGDRLGLISQQATTSPFRVFAISDTQNSQNSSGWVEALWTFSFSDYQADRISVEYAAMGDFEKSDSFDLSYLNSAQSWVSLFEIDTDESSHQDYILASGKEVRLNDPVQVNGTYLNNSFTELDAILPSVSDTITIKLSAKADSGSEVFALRNLNIWGESVPAAEPVIPEPGLSTGPNNVHQADKVPAPNGSFLLACIMLTGIAFARMR